MQILVLYHSRNGHTRQTAEAIAEAIRNVGHRVTIKSVIEVRQTDVEQADLLFIGTWVQGFILFGVKPAAADLWIPALPTLTGKSVAIFCTYAFNPRRSLSKLTNLLAARGATVIGQQAFQHNHSTDSAGDFAKRILATLGTV